MLTNNLTQFKGRLQAAAMTAAWYLAAGLAALAAICWLSAALFIWLLESHTPLAASSIMGGIWIVLAASFALGGWLVRRARRRELARLAMMERSRPPPGWINPSTLAAGLDVAQLVGGKRASAIVAGAFAVTWLLGRLAQPRTDAPPDDAA